MAPAYLRLIRTPNLIIVGLTQWLIYSQLFGPLNESNGLGMALPPWQFSIFVLVTVLITAAGYVINDITDFKTDIINRPKKVIINRIVPSQTAYWIYFQLKSDRLYSGSLSGLSRRQSSPGQYLSGSRDRLVFLLHFFQTFAIGGQSGSKYYTVPG